MEEKKWFFSMFSGELYTVPLDEAKFLDAHQIALKDKPDSKCNKCYGRLYETYLTPANVFQLCKKCSKKYIDLEYMKIPIKER